MSTVHLGYITSRYGRTSDTFIRQEVRQLRLLGHTVRTFSIRRPDPEDALNDAVRAEQASTEYILEAGTLRMAGAALLCALCSPARMARAIALAWKGRAPGFKALLWQLAYLIEASFLARRIASLGIEHVHNHIGMNSSTVCMLAAVLSDVTWSMTVHGPHDLVEPAYWALPLKLESSEFTVFVAEFGRSQGMLLAPRPVWPRLHVVRCGLDETFFGQPLKPIPQAPRLVFVGRLSPEKGVAILVEAVARLKREHVRIELALIGDGPSRPEIEEAIARHGLGDQMKLLGWQGSERVREAILSSRALVLPSFAEGLPIVLMEALALHRPVVSTQVAGIPELVQTGVTGFLVPPGSLDDLVEAMRAVALASVEQLDEMGRRGAARVAQRHDARVNARQLEALFSQAVCKRRGAA